MPSRKNHRKLKEQNIEKRFLLLFIYEFLSSHISQYKIDPSPEPSDEDEETSDEEDEGFGSKKKEEDDDPAASKKLETESSKVDKNWSMQFTCATRGGVRKLAIVNTVFFLSCFIPEAKALAEKQMNEAMAMAQSKCSLQ